MKCAFFIIVYRNRQRSSFYKPIIHLLRPHFLLKINIIIICDHRDFTILHPGWKFVICYLCHFMATFNGLFSDGKPHGGHKEPPQKI